MFNVDSVAALVPQGITVQARACISRGRSRVARTPTAPDVTRTLLTGLDSLKPPQALLDSSLWINVQPYEPSITSLADQCQAALPLFNATGVLNAQCVAAQAPGDEYLCLMGQYLLPYLNTPYFLYESQFDAFQARTHARAERAEGRVSVRGGIFFQSCFGVGSERAESLHLALPLPQLPYNMGGMPTVKNASEMTYANDWQGSLIAVIQNLPAPNQPDSGIFSLSCLRHCLTMGSAFWGAMVRARARRFPRPAPLGSGAPCWCYCLLLLFPDVGRPGPCVAADRGCLVRQRGGRVVLRRANLEDHGQVLHIPEMHVLLIAGRPFAWAGRCFLVLLLCVLRYYLLQCAAGGS